MKRFLLGLSGLIGLACGGQVVFVSDDGAGGDGAGGSSADGTPPPSGGFGQGGCLNGGCGGFGFATCEQLNPAGFELAKTLVIQSCACQAGAPCEEPCLGDAACFSPGVDPSGPACAECLVEVANQSSQCALDALLGVQCQNDAQPGGCVDYVNCLFPQE